ncbi:hypothetical protein Pla22_46160 [Rubripirellula amarantea]|uniref:Uncharacterized protein n=1 Tax=Rubripirellula amarantea TaxID=2527999 RepID=A0A5C5WFI9_9BACT|nr:hypothetical protein Pla22_46160 [Rubripirellula amarantea]
MLPSVAMIAKTIKHPRRVIDRFFIGGGSAKSVVFVESMAAGERLTLVLGTRNRREDSVRTQRGLIWTLVVALPVLALPVLMLPVLMLLVLSSRVLNDHFRSSKHEV